MQRAYEAWWKLGLSEESEICESIAIPGSTVGTERLTKGKLARTIVDGLINQFNTWFVNAPLKRVVIFDNDEEILDELEKTLKLI